MALPGLFYGGGEVGIVKCLRAAENAGSVVVLVVHCLLCVLLVRISGNVVVICAAEMMKKPLSGVQSK